MKIAVATARPNTMIASISARPQHSRPPFLECNALGVLGSSAVSLGVKTQTWRAGADIVGMIMERIDYRFLYQKRKTSALCFPYVLFMF